MPPSFTSLRPQLAVAGDIVKSEGIGGLYKGLSAGLLRQATYTTGRLGFYNTIYSKASDYYGGVRSQPPSLSLRLLPRPFPSFPLALSPRCVPSSGVPDDVIVMNAGTRPDSSRWPRRLSRELRRHVCTHINRNWQDDGLDQH